MLLLLLACSEPRASTDSAALARRVPTAPNWTEVRWAERQMEGGLLEAGDTWILASFPGADTSELTRLGDRDVLLDGVLASELGLPATLSGERFEPEVFDSPRWDTNFVIETPQHGVVVTWISR